jgi:hypothetical protein
MPPESPYETVHLPYYPQSVFCRLLRPELLAHIKQHNLLPPLSPDALSAWSGSGTPASDEHNLNVRRATYILCTQVIPKFARDLITSVAEGTALYTLPEFRARVRVTTPITCRFAVAFSHTNVFLWFMVDI